MKEYLSQRKVPVIIVLLLLIAGSVTYFTVAPRQMDKNEKGIAVDDALAIKGISKEGIDNEKASAADTVEVIYAERAKLAEDAPADADSANAQSKEDYASQAGIIERQMAIIERQITIIEKQTAIIERQAAINPDVQPNASDNQAEGVERTASDNEDDPEEEAEDATEEAIEIILV